MKGLLSIFILLGSSFIIHGCTVSSPAPIENFYRLNTLSSSVKIEKPLPGMLLVSKLTSRGFAGERRIVFWDALQPQETQRYNYHLWVETPVILIQDILTQALRQAGIASQVITSAQGVRADYILSGTLYRMEQRIEAEKTYVLIDIELGLVKSDSKKVLLLKRYVISEDTVDNQIPGAVEAFERALSKLVSKCLADVSHLERTAADFVKN